MTATPTGPAQPAHPAGDAPEATAVFRRALRDMAVLVAGVTVLGVGIGYLVAGAPGVWGALIGAGIALVFSGATTLSMLWTSPTEPGRMMAVIMGMWLGKVALVIVLLAVLRGMDFYDRYVLAAVVAVAVIGSALLDYRAVSRGRIPYVSPASAGTEVPNADDSGKSM
ncbi:hypothetical protein [Cellulomonas triticagri]|uniref:Uncharacterized protein n=1 Tax=Cellulomonas triticagri TaxID=2483352 RepID=A0A3M2IW77_9CELL|nr:hypothetical protein [Cellulomonas triticagri]RMI04694.1 hypothetical protein EBM89_18050 [Cellulomonas triticagri]